MKTGWVLLAAATMGAAAPTVIPPLDFVEYWAAARIHVQGGDPYDPDQLLPLQREATGNPDQREAVLLWTPPWTLPLYVPFGLLDPRTAHLAWLATQAGMVLLSAGLLWRVYAGPRGSTGWGRILWFLAPLGVGIFFGPGWWLIAYGQNVGFILLGLAGFLALRGRYPFAAGLVGALTAVKPHLLTLFALALLLDAATPAGRRVLLGGVVALVVASVVAILPNPDVFADFVTALSRPHSPEAPALRRWQLPLLGNQIRWAINPDPDRFFWVQFVPCLLAALLLLVYWWPRRHRWEWTTETPRLVLASALVAPYGGWIFDLTILLVPVIDGFTRMARHPRFLPVTEAITAYALISFATLLVPLFVLRLGQRHGLEHFLWVTPAVLAWYLAVVGTFRPAVSPAVRPGS